MISDRGEGPSIFYSTSFDRRLPFFVIMEWNGMERKLENCSRL